MISGLPWDVAVIGAGPAGSAAAYHLAAKGRRVVMVDRSVFPRDKACGDGLTRTSVELLADLGVLEKFKSSTAITGAQLINRGGTHHNAPYRPRGPGRPGYGLVVPRIELDNILRKHAMAAGADVVYQATFFDGKWVGYADFLLRVERPDPESRGSR